MLKLNRCCRDHKLLALRMSYFFANFRQVWANVFTFSEGHALCIEYSRGLVFLAENYPFWEWFHEDNKRRFKMLQSWSSLNSGEITVHFHSVEKKHASPSLGHSPSSWRLTRQVLLSLLLSDKELLIEIQRPACTLSLPLQYDNSKMVSSR